MPHRLVFLAILCFYFVACTAAKETSESKAQATLPQQTIIINSHKLLVEVATTATQRRAGLAHRKNLKPDNGMLFIYANSEIRNFTTAQTTLKLSIAFLDEQGRILDMQKMQPLNQSSYRSRSKARYVLEVNQEWFEKKKVKLGDRVLLPKDR